MFAAQNPRRIPYSTRRLRRRCATRRLPYASSAARSAVTTSPAHSHSRSRRSRMGRAAQPAIPGCPATPGVRARARRWRRSSAGLTTTLASGTGQGAESREASEMGRPCGRRPTPTLFHRQAAIGVDLALERGQERRTRWRRQTPGVVRGVEEMRADSTSQGSLRRRAASCPPIHKASLGQGPDFGSWTAGRSFKGPTQYSTQPSTVTIAGRLGMSRRTRWRSRRKRVTGILLPRSPRR